MWRARAASPARVPPANRGRRARAMARMTNARESVRPPARRCSRRWRTRRPAQGEVAPVVEDCCRDAASGPLALRAAEERLRFAAAEHRRLRQFATGRRVSSHNTRRRAVPATWNMNQAWPLLVPPAWAAADSEEGDRTGLFCVAEKVKSSETPAMDLKNGDRTSWDTGRRMREAGPLLRAIAASVSCSAGAYETAAFRAWLAGRWRTRGSGGTEPRRTKRELGCDE